MPGLLQPKECDPPLPKDSPVSCFDQLYYETWECSAHTIAISPSIYDFSWDWETWHKNGGELWCEVELPIVTRHPTLPLPEVERPDSVIMVSPPTPHPGRLWREDCCGGVVPVESLDVPAIQETRHTKCISAYLWPGPACQGYEDEMVTTCADKTRILEHDEATPAKWWCRKVQSR